MQDLAKIKSVLEERRTFLSTKADEIEDTLREPGDPNFAENAAEREDDEVMEGLEHAALSEISEIDEALERIENGTYGKCVTCGEPINEKRLEAVPHAAQCIACVSK